MVVRFDVVLQTASAGIWPAVQVIGYARTVRCSIETRTVAAPDGDSCQGVNRCSGLCGDGKAALEDRIKF